MWQTIKSSCKASRKDGERNIDILVPGCFVYSPKKRGLQDKDFNRNLGLSLLWQGIPALQRAAPTSFRQPQAQQFPRAEQIEQKGRDALVGRRQGKNGSPGTEKAFATKLLDKTEPCRENKICNETVRRLTSLLLAPLLQRGPGVLAESLTSHWDA